MEIKNITYGMTYKGYKRYRECLNMLECLRQYEGSEVAKERLRIIQFYEEFGEKATQQLNYKPCIVNYTFAVWCSHLL